MQFGMFDLPSRNAKSVLNVGTFLKTAVARKFSIL